MAENPNGNGSPRAAAPLSIFEQRKKGRTVLDDIALEVTGYADSHRQQFCDEMSALFERYVVRVERELPELATFVNTAGADTSTGASISPLNLKLLDLRCKVRKPTVQQQRVVAAALSCRYITGRDFTTDMDKLVLSFLGEHRGNGCRWWLEGHLSFRERLMFEAHFDAFNERVVAVVKRMAGQSNVVAPVVPGASILGETLFYSIPKPFRSLQEREFSRLRDSMPDRLRQDTGFIAEIMERVRFQSNRPGLQRPSHMTSGNHLKRLFSIWAGRDCGCGRGPEDRSFDVVIVVRAVEYALGSLGSALFILAFLFLVDFFPYDHET